MEPADWAAPHDRLGASPDDREETGRPAARPPDDQGQAGAAPADSGHRGEHRVDGPVIGVAPPASHLRLPDSGPGQAGADRSARETAGQAALPVGDFPNYRSYVIS
jgi:hypothetical protein